MTLYRSSSGVYRSPLLDSLSWLDHGFGTALASPPEPFLTLKQTHSATVVNSLDWSPGTEGDALLTGRPGERVAVKTADCVPLLLVDGRRRAVAAVHAGWRGTVQEIAGHALARMTQTFGTDPADILAVIGPAIGHCCFTVGPEVSHLFQKLFPERCDLNERTQLDLAEANRRTLVTYGANKERIFTAATCTSCSTEFHSWRRDRQTGCRMYSMVGLR